jgi:hypothetical protein
MRDLTVGEAVKAMVLNGLGFINQALYLVPMFFQNKPTYRLISPRVAPAQLNDDTLGRALDTLYNSGVTALYSLIAATAAKRLGLSPTYVHLDSTSFHVDSRYNSDELPSEQCVACHVLHGLRELCRIEASGARLREKNMLPNGGTCRWAWVTTGVAAHPRDHAFD